MDLAEELQIPSAQGTLAAKAWGDPRQPPVLALHGWLDNAGSFDRLAPLLMRERYVVALDLRGHGRSAHAAGAAWLHYIDYFDDLRAVFDHFGWKRADLLGHSLGGTLASLFAALYPEPINELWLIEALGPLTASAADTLAQLRRALDQRKQYAQRRPLRIFPDLAAAVAARMTANGLDKPAARALVERGLRKVDDGFVWSSDPRLTLSSPQRFTEAQVLAMLAGIRASTLLVLAEPPTSYLPTAMMEARAAQVDEIRIVRIPGHHHLHLENAQAVADAIAAFRARSATPTDERGMTRGNSRPPYGAADDR